MTEPSGTRVSARSQIEVCDARGYQLSESDLREWHPFYPLEIYWARKHGLAVAEARRWSEAGVSVQDAVRATGVGLALEEVRRWLGLGFLAADAIEAADAGMPLDTAVRWGEAGFLTLDAILLVCDGWTLDNARAARYSEVDRYRVKGPDLGVPGPAGGVT
jgi:hypothetical protein